MASPFTKFDHLRIPLEDVKTATNNFNDDNIITEGDCEPTYKGQLLHSGRMIKITARRLDRKYGIRDVEFWSEISVLSDLKHTNIVSFIGFCDEEDVKIIITTYHPKGSLNEYLNSSKLTCTQRLRISVGVAHALSYLHHEEGRGYGVIHRNINSYTILLDENWEAKLHDFEICIKQPNSRMDHPVLCEPIGIHGYTDPTIENTGGVSHKSDIYSFGVVLFEILCGRAAYIENATDELLAPMAKYHYENNSVKNIIHPGLWNEMSPQALVKYSNIAYSCLEEEPSHRPDINDIAKQLEVALELQLRRENVEKKLGRMKISLTDIKLATSNFSKKFQVACPNYCALYVACLERSNKEDPSPGEGKNKHEHLKRLDTVVIKRYPSRDDMFGEEQFFTEIEMLTSVNHPNIVTLLGFCVDDFEMILVIKNVYNGYLGFYLRNINDTRRFLTWEKRLIICIDVAYAMCYLHFDMEDQKTIINRVIQCFSIMLDENMRATIVDFWYSIFLPPGQEALYVDFDIGRKYSRDPDYEKTGKLKRESDVYSFGVLLFEMLCGRTADDPIYLEENVKGLGPVVKRCFSNGTIVDMIDPLIKEETFVNNFVLHKGPNKDSIETFIKIAYQCIAETQDQRPTMKVVSQELKKALFFHENNIDKLRRSLEDVKMATQNFHDDNCIGGGSFGKVYKGKVPHGDGFNIIVAKLFDTRFGEVEQQFSNELQILFNYKHQNIIGLLGYCTEKNERIIVYEYAARISLDRYLDDASFTWMKRLNICIDVASTLGFLHEGVGKAMVIHGDIRTTNILVNHDWKAKLADFRLSLISQRNRESGDVIGHVSGTIGFLTTKSDIYSFGVVLFEILCGRSTLAIHKYEGHYLPDFIINNFEKEKHDEIVFEQIKDQIVPKSLTTFQTIAYQCLYREKEKRPTAKEVLVQLKKALEFQEQGQCQNVEQKMDQVDKRPPKTLELQGNNLEYLKIPLTDITLATNNFFKTYRILSWDAYNLYRAKLDHFDKENPSHVEGEHPKTHNTVIIKWYPEGHDLFTKEAFFTEIEILTSVKHPNIITLLGFCIESSEMILVTENVPNGYLDSYLGNLNKMSILTWERRLRICIDVACALSYLHFEVEDQKTIVNRNISSGSIGLDENWKAKISDFGLSAYLSPNQDNNKGLSLKSPVGSTRFYIDPEYVKSGKLKRELDVYSFGVVLFEILCGRKAFDPIYKGSGNDLASMVRKNFGAGTLDDMIDPIIKEETSESKFLLNKGPNKDSLNTFIEIAHQCVAEAEDERPSMKVVVEKLKKALFFQKNNKDNPRISLEDIKLATNNFHDSNCVGGGGFGGVYKGKLQDGDGFKTIVAKRLDRKLGQGEQQFSTELQILLEYKHKNVIGLVGYYDEEDEKVIVYEYASRGSLDRYLGNASLTWVERLHICIDVANALYFLHSGVGRQAKVIHRDIKTPNILLNHEWKAKLGDFGLSLISPIIQDKDYVIDRACGTRGYLDPLYRKSGFLTIESDIYSFGVVLFEILCGRSTNAIRKHEGEFLSGFVKNRSEDGKLNEVVFKHIRKEIEPKSLLTFQEIAYKCLHHERENRPTTREVLMQLKKALELQNMTSTMTNFASLKIPLENVVKATQDFHHDNTIRHDEFSTTYRGRLLWSGRLMNIAARRFDCKNAEADLKFLSELSVLYDLKHTNLVSIIGFCEEKDEKIIITTYEAKGSLAQYLNNSNLTWTQRLRIGVGVARALSYLLYDEGRNYAVIHCNINSDTILLDENWEAKLSGFEYSVKQLVYHKDQVCLCEHIDTMGRMDPAIEKTGGVTQMSDIYSLGVVLFEILCGRKAFMQNDANKFLAPWAKYHFENRKLHDIIHHDLFSNQMSPQSLLKHTNVAYSCLNEDRAQRPDMEVIVEELENALELQLRVEEKIGQNLERLKISLSDIKLATNNFSKAYLIASWEHSTWYRAELRFDNKSSSSVEGKDKGEHTKGHNVVVIKRYPFGHHVYGEEAFFTEIEMLTTVKHANIVTLLGFCIEGSELIIVIENVPNGYLGHHYLGNVNRMRILTWEKRLRICVDVALALNYLHSEMEDQKMIINCDINSRNVVLDENFHAKIVDFWFSVVLPSKQEETLYLNKYVRRRPYIDPEYAKTGKLTRKSDVYSFGVLLFEILCDKGLLPVISQHFCTEKVEEMIDPILKGETGENTFDQDKGPNKDSLHTFIEIAQQCVAETQTQRPTMNVVVKKLKKALSFQISKAE